MVPQQTHAPASPVSYRADVVSAGIGSRALIILRELLPSLSQNSSFPDLWVLDIVVAVGLMIGLCRVDYKLVACPAEIVQKSGCGVTGGAKFRY